MQRWIRVLVTVVFVLLSAYQSGAWLRYVDRVIRNVGVTSMQFVREDAIGRARVALLLIFVFQALAVLAVPIYFPRWLNEKEFQSRDPLLEYARAHPATFVYSIRLAVTVLAMVLAMFSYYFISYVFEIKLFTLR